MWGHGEVGTRAGSVGRTPRGWAEEACARDGRTSRREEGGGAAGGRSRRVGQPCWLMGKRLLPW